MDDDRIQFLYLGGACRMSDNDWGQWAASHLASEFPTASYADPDGDESFFHHLGWVPQPGDKRETATPESEAYWDQWRGQQPQARVDFIDRLQKHFTEWVQKQQPWSTGWKRPVSSYDDAIIDWPLIADYIRTNFPQNKTDRNLNLPPHTRGIMESIMDEDLDPVQEAMIALHNRSQGRKIDPSDTMFNGIKRREDKRTQDQYYQLVEKQRQQFPQLFTDTTPRQDPQKVIPFPILPQAR